MWSLHIVTLAGSGNRRRAGRRGWHVSDLSGYLLLVLPVAAGDGEGDHLKGGGGVAGADQRGSRAKPRRLLPITPPPRCAGFPSPSSMGRTNVRRAPGPDPFLLPA